MGWTKHYFLLLFLILLIVPITYAQITCEYTDYEEYYMNETVLTYELSNKISGKALELSDFTQGNFSSFMAYNPNDFEVVAMFKFTVEGHGGSDKEFGIRIKPQDYGKVKEICYHQSTWGECYINQSSIEYFIVKPELMYPKNLNIKKIGEICDIPCTKPSECYTGICNIAGFCDTKKIVDCPDGTKNCNDERCIRPSIKEAGEAYLCNWECESGIGMEGVCKWKDKHSCLNPNECLSGECNIAKKCGPFVSCPSETQNCEDKQCLKPTIKKAGEAYSCDWECKSGRGSKGICKRSIREILIFISIIFLIIGSSIHMINKGRKKKLIEEMEKEREKMLEQTKKDQNEIIRDTKQKYIRQIKDIKRIVKNKEENMSRLTKEIRQKENEIEQRENKIKKLEREEPNLIRRKEEISRLREETKTEQEELKKEQEELKKQEFEYLKHREQLKSAPAEERKIPRLNKQGDLVYIDEKGYECKYYKGNLDPYRTSAGWKKYFHVDWYEKKILKGGRIKHGHEIHHIDRDITNNNIQNLIELSPMQHKEVHELINRTKMSGIGALKKLGIKADHIRELNS